MNNWPPAGPSGLVALPASKLVFVGVVELVRHQGFVRKESASFYVVSQRHCWGRGGDLKWVSWKNSTARLRKEPHLSPVVHCVEFGLLFMICFVLELVLVS